MSRSQQIWQNTVSATYRHLKLSGRTTNFSGSGECSSLSRYCISPDHPTKPVAGKITFLFIATSARLLARDHVFLCTGRISPLLWCADIWDFLRCCMPSSNDVISPSSDRCTQKWIWDRGLSNLFHSWESLCHRPVSAHCVKNETKISTLFQINWCYISHNFYQLLKTPTCIRRWSISPLPSLRSMWENKVPDRYVL